MSKEQLEVALSALGWDKVGTGHSLDSMILEIFSNYNDSIILWKADLTLNSMLLA